MTEKDLEKINTGYKCPHYYIDTYGNKRCFAQICDAKIGARRCDGKVYKECFDTYKAKSKE